MGVQLHMNIHACGYGYDRCFGRDDHASRVLFESVLSEQTVFVITLELCNYAETRNEIREDALEETV